MLLYGVWLFGMVLIVYGLGEYIGWYDVVVVWLNSWGWYVVGYD